MVNMRLISQKLVVARPYFTMVNPSMSSIFRYPKHALMFKGFNAVRHGLIEYDSGVPMPEVVGHWLGTRVIKKTVSPVKRRMTMLHIQANQAEHDFWRKNGVGGRSWITEPGRYDIIMVFHDANRAGPHIDVHIGRLSLIYRVKPDLYQKLRYNSHGELTQASRDLLIGHVRSEIGNRSRVPQNIDHSKANARSSWFNGDPEEVGYGSGRTRQVILDSQVDVLKAHADGPIEFYSPELNPYRVMYIHRLYPGTDKRAPIVIWGNKTHEPPPLEDRLHLTLVHPENLSGLSEKADLTTSTAKLDGSSCYFVITPKGTTVWSPRLSVKTGERIEYTFNIGGLAGVSSDQTIVGMGELVFVRSGHGRDRTNSRYLSSAAGSGLINSHALLPSDVRPEIHVYRIDRIGRENTSALPFWENRALQQEVSQLDPKHLKVVELMQPDKALAKGYEGVVIAPPDRSVNDAYKIKWWADSEDWRITSVKFQPGPSGKVAGVVKATSLESGKTFKLGPSQVGNETLTRDMMANPEDYTGRVIKVHGRQGHQGRAAKVIDFHSDK